MCEGIYVNKMTKNVIADNLTFYSPAWLLSVQATCCTFNFNLAVPNKFMITLTNSSLWQGPARRHSFPLQLFLVQHHHYIIQVSPFYQASLYLLQTSFYHNIIRLFTNHLIPCRSFHWHTFLYPVLPLISLCIFSLCL